MLLYCSGSKPSFPAIRTESSGRLKNASDNKTGACHIVTAGARSIAPSGRGGIGNLVHGPIAMNVSENKENKDPLADPATSWFGF